MINMKAVSWNLRVSRILCLDKRCQKLIIIYTEQDISTHLRCSGDHVLDEVTMSGGINDGDIVLGSLELPESNINGDTSLTLSLQLVQHPGILEGSLARLGRLLLELLNGSLVNTSALVDQVTSGGGLARVDVSNDNNVDMSLFLAHGASSRLRLILKRIHMSPKSRETFKCFNICKLMTI